MKTEYPEIFALSVEKKIELLGELWDSIQLDEVPAPQWHIEELERRKREFEQNPNTGLSWEEAKRQILSRHGE